MLKRIENISPNSAYKEKPYQTISAKEAYHTEHIFLGNNDSSNFSDAIKYWGLLKWKLKQFKQNTNGLFDIEFSIEDFNFHISLSEIDYHSQSAEYTISAKEAIKSEDRTGIVKIKLNFPLRIFSNPRETTELYFLESFFNRLSELKKINPYFGNNSDTKQILLHELEEGLVSELSDIHNKLILFLDKATNYLNGSLNNNSIGHNNEDSGEVEIIEVSFE